MRCKITKALIDRTHPKEKTFVLFDSELPGFALKILPSGGKVFQLRYRMGGRDAPKKTYTLGRYGQLTPDGARKQAQVLLGDIRRGVDPSTEKARVAAEHKSAQTLAAVAADFMEIHVSKRRISTANSYKWLLDKLVLTHLGMRRIRDITPGEVERWHHNMRATPYQANRALAVLSKLMSWATQRGHRTGENPCRAVEKFSELARRRYLSPAEIARVLDSIRNLEASGALSIHLGAFFELLLLTGMRKSELRLLTWERVDFERSVLVLGELDSKTGSRDIPLSARALQILNGLPRLSGNPYVFVGKLAGKPLVNVAKPWKRILTTAGIDHARPHDLRHTTASIGIAAGYSLPLIGGVLGHKSQATTARYAHLADDAIRATTEIIGERISNATEHQADDPVIPLRR